MTKLLDMFTSQDGGQYLIEYSLCLAFICLVATATFMCGGQPTGGVWSIMTDHLVAPNL